MLSRWRHASHAGAASGASAVSAMAAAAAAAAIPARAAIASAASAVSVLHPHAAIAIVGVRHLHSSASLHGRRDKSELDRFKVRRLSDDDVRGGAPKRGAARAWSVRSGSAAPTRRQKREAFAEHRATHAPLTPDQQQAQTEGVGAAGLDAEEPSLVAQLREQNVKSGRRSPQHPSSSSLSHTSSDFFRSLSSLPPPASASADAASTPVAPPQFKDLGVASHVHNNLAPTFDIFTPTPIQAAAIPFLLSGGPAHFTERDDPSDTSPQAAARRARMRRRTPLPRDLIIQDMTGAGKTLSYVLPLLTMVDNFKQRTLQGIVVAPTRELAVQIFRVLRKINHIHKAGKRRKANPLTLRLAVGTVTESYAAQVRDDPCHIIVATPHTLNSLLHGVRGVRKPGDSAQSTPAIIVRPSITVRHLRMLVLDEVDHLLLPATVGSVERILQTLTSTPAHGSMHRLARIVLVSAALSQRVYDVASKWLHRPVTATSDGLLDGWIDEQRLLRDKYALRKPVDASAAAATTAGTPSDAAQRLDVDEDEDDDDESPLDLSPSSDDLAQQTAVSEDVPVLSVSERLAARGLDLESMSPELRAAYEEADEIFVEDAEEDEDVRAEMRALRELKHIDAEEKAQAKRAELTVGTALDEDAEAIERKTRVKVLRADEFVLPGSAAARQSAKEAVEAAAAAAAAGASPDAAPAAVASSSSTAAVAGDAEERIMPLLADFPAPSADASPFGSPSSLAAQAAAADAAMGEEAAAEAETPLPSASRSGVRYLPASMQHLAVHVSPEAKPKLYPTSSSEDRAHALAAWAKLLAQLHAALKPRVALVFFKRAADALALADVLRKQKHMGVELLLSGGGLQAADRLRAIECVQAGTIQFLLATDLAARGLDLRGLSHVINFDPAPTALDFVHRAGRVERLGGRKGCTVVNIVRDYTQSNEAYRIRTTERLQAEGIDVDLALPSHRRKLAQANRQVDKLARLQQQLNVHIPAVRLISGKFVPLEEADAALAAAARKAAEDESATAIKSTTANKQPSQSTPRVPSSAPVAISLHGGSSVTTMGAASSHMAAAVSGARAFSSLARRLTSSLSVPFPVPWRRLLHTRSSPLLHNSTATPGGAPVHVTFITPEGERVSVTGAEGENLLALAHANGVELEGACEASLACSTCHVILPDAYYAKLDTPCDEEADMLDLAFGLTDTSRLGCQVKLSPELEGMEITLPSATRNMAVDGHKPKPH